MAVSLTILYSACLGCNKAEYFLGIFTMTETTAIIQHKRPINDNNGEPVNIHIQKFTPCDFL